MLVDLLLTRLCDSRVPPAPPLGFEDFLLPVLAFAFSSEMFEVLQEESQARLQRPSRAVAVRIRVRVCPVNG
ncbi:hypothetical protein ACIQCQ_28990 [Streptomyces sp. NPDC088394]|uniref:hypothetical protein n=1 Tax=unclassified Streptomyces TaxID=2593676 RepID=UPI00342D6B7E